MATFKSIGARVYFSIEDGQHLALQMLHDFESADADSCSLEEQFRPGKPQQNIVLGYLKALAASDSEQLTEGFASVLSDYVSSCTGGGVPHAIFYEGLLGSGITPVAD